VHCIYNKYIIVHQQHPTSQSLHDVPAFLIQDNQHYQLDVIYVPIPHEQRELVL